MRSGEMCKGTLIWYEVQGDRTFPLSAILQCSHCAEIFVCGGYLDTRHHGAPVMREGVK